MPSDSPVPASFSTDPSVVVSGPKGQLCHRDHLAQSALFELRLEQPTDGVWTVLGNGLANITAIDAPDGLIIVDTGECNEEMAAALAMIRQHTDRPVAAVIYTHFHYVSGTAALATELQIDDLEIWGHARVGENLLRAGGEIGQSYIRGLIHQFGVRLPDDGPDGLVNVGTGASLINPAHAPRTPGYVPATHTFTEEQHATIAGLDVVMTPAESDSDDSITIWVPSKAVAINNIMWPALFNIFPIRGESYRDPQVLLGSMDHIIGLQPEHLLCTHGPPLSGRDDLQAKMRLYRDSIQFIWDQTVRGANRGLTATELIEFVQLPDIYGRDYLTAQRYGIVEHYARQVRNGLFGWFDGDEADLFPLPAADRCTRLIEGFGGRAEVAAQAQAALDDDELRWALELASWLVRSEAGPDGRADGGSDDERGLLANVLRTIAQRTTAANIRNYCLTRALELDGTIDLSKNRSPRFPIRAIKDGTPIDFVHTLRVQLDPVKAAGIDFSFAVELDGAQRSGLHVRNAVAAPTGGDGATAVLHTDTGTFAQIWSGRMALTDAIAAGTVSLTGDVAGLTRTLACFDSFATSG